MSDLSTKFEYLEDSRAGRYAGKVVLYQKEDRVLCQEISDAVE
jgi:hypothetical protein